MEKQAAMKQPNKWWLITLGILSAITALFILFLKKRKKPAHVKVLASSIMPDIDQSLQPAEIALKINAPQFYTTLQKNIWDYLGATLQLSGSRMNKNDLENTMNVKGLSAQHAAEILQVLAACEAGAFTSADLNADREQLFTRAKAVLGAIRV
jgi:hypothetical protein